MYNTSLPVEDYFLFFSLYFSAGREYFIYSPLLLKLKASGFFHHQDIQKNKNQTVTETTA
jgi:hypothetical protein